MGNQHALRCPVHPLRYARETTRQRGTIVSHRTRSPFARGRSCRRPVFAAEDTTAISPSSRHPVGFSVRTPSWPGLLCLQSVARTHASPRTGVPASRAAASAIVRV